MLEGLTHSALGEGLGAFGRAMSKRDGRGGFARD